MWYFRIIITNNVVLESLKNYVFGIIVENCSVFRIADDYLFFSVRKYSCGMVYN